jgi:transposase
LKKGYGKKTLIRKKTALLVIVLIMAAYFGIVPRVSDSNAKVYHGRITKNGSKIGRTTLVQCTLVAKRYSPYLCKYYERIKRHRRSGKASGQEGS